MRANVAELLGPVLGANNFKVSVTADIDNDRIEETQEKYGEAPKVTSEAMREELEKQPPCHGRARHAVEPPAGARRAGRTGRAQGAGAAAAAAEKDDSNRARTRPPASTPTTARSPRSSARAAASRKLSVAVVLNNAGAANAKAGYTPGELANIEKILRGGLGIDEARGDVLAVSGLSFPAAAPSDRGGRNATPSSTPPATACGSSPPCSATCCWPVRCCAR